MNQPCYEIGQEVSAAVARPPWTSRPVALTIDGMRLHCTYEESWPVEEGPAILTRQPQEWEYRVVRYGKDQYGNETVNEWGWLKESEIEPMPVEATA